MKIMIVEDNPRILEMIKNILKRNIDQIEDIYECINAQQAIDQYEKLLPDLVLMDIKLNKMDGLTASEIILHKNSDAKIIIVTQYDDQVYKDQAKKIGVLDYIIKDKLQELVSIIKNI